jgi:hypothetical protein
LNAEPRAEAAFPGSFRAVELRQVWEGWPIPFGFLVATTVVNGTNTKTKIAVTAIKELFMLVALANKASRLFGP